MALATRCSNGFELDPGVDLFSEGTFIPSPSLSNSTAWVGLFVGGRGCVNRGYGKRENGKSIVDVTRSTPLSGSVEAVDVDFRQKLTVPIQDCGVITRRR